MNFKRNLFVITSALVGALALSGCDFEGLSKFEHFSFIEPYEDKHETIENVGNIKIGDYASYVVTDKGGNENNLGSAYEVMRDYSGASHIPSEGKQKIIVVPVEFSDFTTSKLNLSNEQYIDLVNKAFFGCSKNNAYVSVGEYFNKSSYGKFSLDGKVCDKVYTFPLSVSEIKESKLSRERLADIYYPKVIEWYKANYDDIEEYKIEGLKANYNIPIYMVYTYPSETQVNSEEENFFWAYTFDKVPLSWSSSSFMYLQYGEPDAHTFIHETGHLLGLSDYYPTIDINDTGKKSGSKRDKDNESEPEEEEKPLITPEPAGRIDMMDCSIGDETSFSKMMLNWTRPTYVYDSCEVTINSFTETGDVVLLANNWNKTVFDEFYLFEYYTPTGLNTYDVSVGNNEAKLPKVPGIKIYHVDSRLGYVSAAKVVNGYLENGTSTPSKDIHNVGFAHDNNTYLNPNEFQKNYLYELILKNESGPKGMCATDASLFRFGDEIPTLKLNRGGELNYKISITYSTFNKIGLKFEKVENSQK